LTTNEWIDPYSSYIVMEVAINPTGMGLNPGGAAPLHLELDGGATSLIRQMLITSDNQLLERIDEYDQLGAILQDLGMPNFNKKAKSCEGMSYFSKGK